MSNRSEENKGGILNGEVLKSFFSVTGEPGSFVHTPGHERIPNNCKYQKNLLSIAQNVLATSFFSFRGFQSNG